MPLLRLRPLALALLVASMAAHATTTPVSGNEPVSSSVSNDCVIDTANSLSFGAYDPTSGMANTANSSFILQCTKGTAYSVTVNGGLHSSAMQGAGGLLNYALYEDAAMSQSWGQGYVISNISSTGYTCINTGYTSYGTLAALQTFADTATYAFTYNYFSGHGYDVHQVYGQSATSSCAKGSAESTSSYASVTDGDAVTADTSGAHHLVNPGLGQSITGTSAGVHTAIDVPFYGKVPANQDLAPGSYSDTVTLIVSF
jgi:spore coat protein U-like protein